MRASGKLLEWNDERGFGFVQPEGSSAKVFVHISAFTHRLPPNQRPAPGMQLSFEIATVEGKPRAQQVQWRSNKVARSHAISNGAVLAYACILGFVGLWFVLNRLWGHLPYALSWYGVFSALCFFSYWKDKSAARNGHWRTAESTLHLQALLGGWPGALLAQQWLRHKSSKASFQTTFWWTVVLNVVALVVVSLPASRTWLLVTVSRLLNMLTGSMS